MPDAVPPIDGPCSPEATARGAILAADAICHLITATSRPEKEGDDE